MCVQSLRRRKKMDKDHSIILKCPYCMITFDFKMISKNNWCVEHGYVVIQCPICFKYFKMKMEEEDG